jgi:peptidoglycan hydrolase-like protein with peptidoglycan-binding domain
LPHQLITENCHAADRKYQLNLSETANAFACLVFRYWNHQRKHTLISGDKTMKAYTTLSKGSNNSDVKYLQQQLNLFYHSFISVDGNFGDKTTMQVKQFQSDFHLSVDGIVGNNTWSVLENIGLKL